MSVLEFVFGVISIIVVFIMFVSWLGIKYDIAERDIKNKKLELEIKKYEEKEERRKKRRYKKAIDNKERKK